MPKTKSKPSKVSESKKSDLDLYEEIIRRTSQRIDTLNEMAGEELNPLRKVELLAKKEEQMYTLHYLKSLKGNSPEDKLVRAIFA